MKPPRTVWIKVCLLGAVVLWLFGVLAATAPQFTLLLCIACGVILVLTAAVLWLIECFERAKI